MLKSGILGNIFNNLLTFAYRRNADGVGKIWAYSGHYYSLAAYINAIFRFYIWDLISQPMFSFFSTMLYVFGGYLGPRSNRLEERLWIVWSVLKVFRSSCWHHWNHRGTNSTPPPTHTHTHMFFNGERNIGSKTAFPDIQLWFRPLYFDSYQTEHSLYFFYF